MSKIFEPLVIKNLDMKNRIVMPPMCMYTSTDGIANDWHFVHYGSRAIGGVGLIIMESTGVTPEGRITNGDLGLWRDQQIGALRRVVDFCHGQGSKIAIQLNHAGRKSLVDSQCAMAPSAVLIDGDLPQPYEMTIEDIEKVINGFGESTRRANEAGFDAIEIHGAHGFLISEFLSPLTNFRQDQYGGNLENRMRFLMEIIASVKRNWPEDKALILRLSVNEYDPKGSNESEKLEMARVVKESGIDIINVSTGGIVNVPIDVYPGYQVSYSEKIRNQAHIPTIAGGLITEENQITEILEEDQGDMVYIGRELLADPHFVLKLASKVLDHSIWPKPYDVVKYSKMKRKDA